MKTRIVMIAGSFSLVALYATWQGAWMPTAVAATETSTVFAAAHASLGATMVGDAEYVGSNKCKKCHLTENKSWEKTRHGTAMETLKPGNAAEAKKKHNLDPEKDYSKDATCVGCHSVGLGKPGGYAIPADEEAAKKMKHLEGVGCESCHGAGGAYIEKHEEIMKSKAKYKTEDMYAVGMTKMDVAVCLTCHNEKSPTVDKSVPFDFEAMKKKGVHESTPLKQRE